MAAEFGMNLKIVNRWLLEKSTVKYFIDPAKMVIKTMSRHTLSHPTFQ